MKKLLITGSEGKIGKELASYFHGDYDVVQLDKTLGHDLTDVDQIKSVFQTENNIYAVIILHALNPTPT